MVHLYCTLIQSFTCRVLTWPPGATWSSVSCPRTLWCTDRGDWGWTCRPLVVGRALDPPEPWPYVCRKVHRWWRCYSVLSRDTRRAMRPHPGTEPTTSHSVDDCSDQLRHTASSLKPYMHQPFLHVSFPSNTGANGGQQLQSCRGDDASVHQRRGRETPRLLSLLFWSLGEETHVLPLISPGLQLSLPHLEFAIRIVCWSPFLNFLCIFSSCVPIKRRKEKQTHGKTTEEVSLQRCLWSGAERDAVQACRSTSEASGYLSIEKSLMQFQQSDLCDISGIQLHISATLIFCDRWRNHRGKLAWEKEKTLFWF